MQYRNHYLEAAFFQEESEAFADTLFQLDLNPRPLQAYLHRKSPNRLGRYFERLIQFWLNKTVRYKVLAFNLQVNENKQTIGEFDFITTEHESGENLHLEVAVKFYLGVGVTRRWSQWVGASTRDDLGKKLARLHHWQLHLGNRSAGSAMLREMGIQNITSKAWVKGRFFYPKAFEKHPLPYGCNPYHERGTWVFAHEMEKLLPADQPYRWVERADWFAPLRQEHEKELVNLRGILQQMETVVSLPAQLVRYHFHDNEWREAERISVVPKAWPNSN